VEHGHIPDDAAAAPVQDIVTWAAVEDIEPKRPEELAPLPQPVVAGPAAHDVVTHIPAQEIIAAGADHDVVAVSASDDIHIRCAAQPIISGGPNHRDHLAEATPRRWSARHGHRGSREHQAHRGHRVRKPAHVPTSPCPASLIRSIHTLRNRRIRARAQGVTVSRARPSPPSADRGTCGTRRIRMPSAEQGSGEGLDSINPSRPSWVPGREWCVLDDGPKARIGR